MREVRRERAWVIGAGRGMVALGLMFAVASCGGNRPMRADWREQAALAMPPADLWKFADAKMAAEVDYETLVGPGAVDPAIAAADPDESYMMDGEAAPPPAQETEVAASETGQAAEGSQVAVTEEGSPKPHKPGALVISAVAVPRVKGSPGQGNAELTEAMRRTLIQAGVPVIDKPRADALTIVGAVKLGPSRGNTQTVGVNWTVSSPDGNILGAIKQSNDIPAGSLDHGWGDTAMYAAEAAATGIFDLIQRFR